MHKESFFKHAAVYGLANLLLQGGSIVLLPIYLRCLSRADYGVLEVVGRLAETVGAWRSMIRRPGRSFGSASTRARRPRCVPGAQR